MGADRGMHVGRFEEVDLVMVRNKNCKKNCVTVTKLITLAVSQTCNPDVAVVLRLIRLIRI